MDRDDAIAKADAAMRAALDSVTAARDAARIALAVDDGESHDMGADMQRRVDALDTLLARFDRGNPNWLFVG
jgi:hypothetical protein